jgi:hypothetical protein
MQTIRRLLAFSLVAAAVACASGNRIDQALPASIDPSRIDVVEITTRPGEVLLRGAVNGSEATSTSRRRGELTNPAGGTGRGEATIRGDEILVTVDRLPSLAFLMLRVDGEPLMSFRTSEDGRADIKLNRTTNRTTLARSK